MSDLCRLIWCALIGLFRSRAALEAEILVLRHQLNVLRRKSPKRLAFGNIDRLVFAGLYRLTPGVLDVLKILKSKTVIRWHRAGFRAYWRWKSRPHGGRPKTPADIRQLIRDMSIANRLWGAPRIHGELLKLGIDVGQTTVAKYMARRSQPPSQGWKTFLRNHADGIASMDLFVVPTISFRLLYGFLILQHSRREQRLKSRGPHCWPVPNRLRRNCWRLLARSLRPKFSGSLPLACAMAASTSRMQIADWRRGSSSCFRRSLTGRPFAPFVLAAGGGGRRAQLRVHTARRL